MTIILEELACHSESVSSKLHCNAIVSYDYTIVLVDCALSYYDVDQSDIYAKAMGTFPIFTRVRVILN